MLMVGVTPRLPYLTQVMDYYIFKFSYEVVFRRDIMAREGMCWSIVKILTMKKRIKALEA